MRLPRELTKTAPFFVSLASKRAAIKAIGSDVNGITRSLYLPFLALVSRSRAVFFLKLDVRPIELHAFGAAGCGHARKANDIGRCRVGPPSIQLRNDGVPFLLGERPVARVVRVEGFQALDRRAQIDLPGLVRNPKKVPDRGQGSLFAPLGHRERGAVSLDLDV